MTVANDNPANPLAEWEAPGTTADEWVDVCAMLSDIADRNLELRSNPAWQCVEAWTGNRMIEMLDREDAMKRLGMAND